MIKIFAGLCPSVPNHLLLKMQIIKLLNSHPSSKSELLLVIFVRGFHLKFSGKCFVKTFRASNTAAVYRLFIQDVIKKDNIASTQHFFCQCIELFLSKHHFNFLGISFRVLFYLEHTKKLQSLRLEACYCNTDTTQIH